METFTEIYYGDSNPFSGIAPTPFVSLDNENIIYSARWGATTSISLNGEITGNCQSDLSFFINRQNELLRRLSNNYQPLCIFENGAAVYSGDHAVIKSIAFEESNYFFSTPFRIDVEVYDKNYWSGDYGITSPVNSVNFEEGLDGVLAVKHTISANGFNTDLLAFENAKNWTIQHTGLNPNIISAFCPTNSFVAPALYSTEETIDRINGHYGIVEIYRLDTKYDLPCVLRYSADTSYDEKDGFTTITLKGLVKGGVGQIDDVRTRFAGLNLYNMAFDQYQKITGALDLSQFPIDEEVSEDVESKTISFQISFNNDPSPLVYVDYTVSTDGNIEAGVCTVSLDATIICRHGHPSFRYRKCKEYFDTLFTPTTLAKKDYDRSAPLVHDGSPFQYPTIKDTTRYNENNGTVGYACEWQYPRRDLSFQITVNPSMYTYALSRPLCPSWLVDKNGYQRGTVAIKGKAVGRNALSNGLAALADIKSKIVGVTFFRKKTSTITTSSDIYSYEFDEVWELT